MGNIYSNISWCFLILYGSRKMCAEYFSIAIQQATTKSRVQVKDKNYERFSLNCLKTQQKVLMSFACFDHFE